MNGRFPKEESRGGRSAKRVVRDVRGELGLGAWGRLLSSLVMSPGEGGLLAEEGLGSVSLVSPGMETTQQ